MDYFYYLFFFIAGATAVFVLYKNRLKKWGSQLNLKIDELKAGDSKNNTELKNADAENLPPEFSEAVEKLRKNIPQPHSEIQIDKKEPEQKNNSEELKKTVNDLYIVNELGQNVTSSLNLQETFHHLFNTINSMMDAAVLELSVYNETSKSWNLFSNLQQPSGSENKTYNNNIAEWSFKNNREIFLADAENDFARYVFQPLTLPDGRMAKSIICFPIQNNNAVSGTLCVISFQQNSFSEYHQKIIRNLLGYISVAIQNAITHEELNVTKQRAERSEKFMQQFLANMSHEIRTPINAVTGMTRLLLEKNPRSEQLKYLEGIRNASDSLLIIINDILDLSKIEAGKIELEQIDFSVFDLVNSVKEIMQFKAEEKGLMLLISVDEKISPILIGDPTRLTQILINLVGNAIKFTEKGKVSLEVRSQKSEARNASDLLPLTANLIFSISDTGIGMSTEQQQKLFQNYAQASSDTARKYGGTGLGLSISKQLVQLQGGTIDVRSRIGEGSVFSFSISYTISKNKTVARKEKTVSKEMLKLLKGIKVLLADDNEYNRIVAKETLELKIENVQVEEVYDGVMAFEMISKNNYDVVLMDLVMPKMNGLEATQKIRNEMEAPKNQVKILALTASVVKSEIDKCFASGMNGFIPKPFKSYELIGAIYNALHGENENAFEEEELTHVIPKEPGKIVDLNYLIEFTEGDPVRLQRFIDLFLAKTPVSISNLKSALEKKDYERIRVIVHSMKPQLRFTGVLQALELAETIELSCMEKNNLEQLPEMMEKLRVICEDAVVELKII